MILFLSGLAFGEGPAEVTIYDAVSELETRHGAAVMLETHTNVARDPTLVALPPGTGSLAGDLSAVVDSFNAASDCDHYLIEQAQRWTAVRLSRWRVDGECVDYVSRFERPLPESANLTIGPGRHVWGGGVSLRADAPGLPQTQSVVDPSQGEEPTPRALVEGLMDANPGYAWRLWATEGDSGLVVEVWHMQTRADRQAERAAAAMSSGAAESTPVRPTVGVARSIVEDNEKLREVSPAVARQLRELLDAPGRSPEDAISEDEWNLLRATSNAPRRQGSPVEE